MEVAWQSITCSLTHVDRNSQLADATPTFNFLPPAWYRLPITALTVHQPLALCLHIKQWLLQTLTTPPYAAPGILRLESLELHLLDNNRAKDPGTLVLLDHAACVGEEKKTRVPVSIMALFMPHQQAIRWFYCALDFSPLLLHLAEQGFLDLKGELRPTNPKHRRLFTYLQHEFLTAVKLPHQPDFLSAQKLTDYCASILHPDTALRRIEAIDDLYETAESPHRSYAQLDLEGDRYLTHLHPAEREICALVQLPCSAYLLLKRRFFHAFAREMGSRYERIGHGRMKVRTEAAHEKWLESECGWKASTERNRRPSRSQRLLKAWAELGFLDEKRYLPWLGRAGGMLEDVAEQDDDVDGDVGEGKVVEVEVLPRGVARARRS